MDPLQSLEIDPLQSLEDEQEILRSVLEALLEFATGLEAGAPVDPKDLEEFAVFLERFSELYHDEKEQSILLPAMVDAGCAWDSGPVSRAREIHLHRSHFVRVLTNAAQREPALSGTEAADFARSIRDYVAKQRKTLETAKTELYPAARSSIPPAKWPILECELRAFDGEDSPRSERSQLAELATQLISRYARAEAKTLR